MMWCHRITCNYFAETKPTGEIARYPSQRHQDENYAATRENPSQILHIPVRNNVTKTRYNFLQKLTIPSAKSLKFPHKSVVLADESLCSVLLGWSLYKENNAAFSIYNYLGMAQYILATKNYQKNFSFLTKMYSHIMYENRNQKEKTLQQISLDSL